MNKITEDLIREFLEQVDRTFPVPLSAKQDLSRFAVKLKEKADLCTVTEEDRILSMVAGYTKNVVNNQAYISVVASVPEAQGKGYASQLVEKFIQLSRENHLEAVHLYTAAGNEKAIRMYKRLGFTELHLEQEERPEDVHLIFYIRN